MSRNLRSIAVVLVLVLATTAAAQAFPLTDRPAIAERGDFLGEVLDWFSFLAPVGPGLTSVWEKARSSMHSNGQPASGPQPAPTTDEGSSMDPNG